MSVFKYLLVIVFVSLPTAASSDEEAITRAALDYIESQHKPNADMMVRALHPKMKKRTYWKSGGKIDVMESSYQGMIDLAATYNIDGDKFPVNPKREVTILDVDRNVATVKLAADDWIDYMHLIKIDGKWTIINVLWQFNDIIKHGVKSE